MGNRVCAGIVLFNPEISRLKQNIHSISNQVESLIIVDNNSDNKSEIMSLLLDLENHILIENSVNRGIAYALNQICELALDNQFSWILTLDQDSICPNGMINKMINHIKIKDIGMIGSRFLNVNNIQNKKSSSKYDSNTIQLVDCCITSGSLMSLKAWEHSGKFDERLFIDCVDYDICFKLRISGYKIIRDNSIIIDHNVGNSSKIKIFGKNIIVYNHNALRNYYFVRNYIYIIKKYKNNTNPFKRIMYVFYWELKKLLFEPNKTETIKSAISGLLDGLKM